MARKDPNRIDLVRNPQPCRPVPTRRRKVNPPRPPLDRPNRFAVPAIDDQIRERLEGPQPDGAVCRGREEVPWWAGGTGDGVERERVDGTRVGDQFARLWRFGLVKLRDAVGYPGKQNRQRSIRSHFVVMSAQEEPNERGRGGKRKRTIRRLVDLVARQISPQSSKPLPVQAPQADVRLGETRRHDGRVLGERDGREAVLRGWRVTFHCERERR